MTELETGRRFDRLETLIEGLATNVVQLTDNVGHLANDVSSLKHDVDGLKHDVGGLKHDVGGLKHDVDGLKQELTRTNDKVEIYQKASQQVVNLAFGLILTAALSIIVPVVLSR